MQPTSADIDPTIALRLLDDTATAVRRTTALRALPSLVRATEALAGLYYVPVDPARPPIPSPSSLAPYRGLISRTLPSDIAGAIALIWDGGVHPDPAGTMWAMIATRTAPLRAVRQEATCSVVDLDRVHPKAAVLAALIWRSMGRPVDPPKVPVLRPGLADIWARAISQRMRRDGHRLGLLGAMALDPLNDPSPRVRCGDDLEAFYQVLAAHRTSLVLRTVDNRPGAVDVADHIGWIDVGTLGWILCDTSTPPAVVGSALRYCLSDDAFEAVTAAMDARGWFPAPKSHAEALALAGCRERGANPFDAPASPFVLGRLEPLADASAAGALVGGYQRRHPRLRVPPGAGHTPPIAAAAFLAAYAWARSGHGERLNTVDLDATALDMDDGATPAEVVLVDQGIIDAQAPLAGLGHWRVPPNADGVVFVVRTTPAFERAEREIETTPIEDGVVQSPPPPPTDLLVVNVDRTGAVALGRLGEDPCDPTPPERTRPPSRLLLRSVTGLSVLDAALVTGGLAAAVGRRLLGRDIPDRDRPCDVEAVGRYLASVWGMTLDGWSRLLQERGEPRLLDRSTARQLDPRHKDQLATAFTDGGPTWESIAATPALNPLAPADTADDPSGYSFDLGPLAHPGVVAWACALTSWSRERIVRTVHETCTPLAADAVLATMAARSWLPVA